MGVIFVLSAIGFLLVNSGILFGMDNEMLLNWLPVVNLLPEAGARGILLGVALGSVTTGLRILMGVDRPYGG